MKVGVLTVLYHQLPLEQALDRIAALGVERVELATGNYLGNAHADPDRLLARPRRARRVQARPRRARHRISALSQHGNPLHPDPAIARRITTPGARRWSSPSGSRSASSSASAAVPATIPRPGAPTG